jgi:hypothetical protein
MDMNEDQWCIERREEVIEYLAKEGVKHGEVSEWPAWDVIPCTSAWAIESLVSPGWVGWWVVCGDHPTDYVSAKDIKEPRYVYEAIALRWQEVCCFAKEGKEHPTVKINLDNPEKIEMLQSRSKMFFEWVSDDENWKYE